MTKADDRLYVVTRADLPVGLASAQCVHAAAALAHDRPTTFRHWHETSQWLVLVTVPDEQTLLQLCADASKALIDHVPWREPDLSGQLTAVALAPGTAARRLCANAPLLGRERQVIAA